IADLHIHSKFSRSTSQNMNLQEIERFAIMKGLSIIGTGDFTHPLWMKEIKTCLKPKSGTVLYAIKSEKKAKIKFIMTAEVSTFFEHSQKKRKVHHVIVSPSIEIAYQITDKLGKFGKLSADGRPILKISGAELIEEIMETSNDNMIFPAHIWTPWYGIFGSKSGFDMVEECYGDKYDKIFALETGLSSDPIMNWRIKALDRFTLLSNSDSHSAYPLRLGREATVFDLRNVTYKEIIDSIKKKDLQKFRFTIETNPSYGKYHWTGHRKCHISMSPKQAILSENICPECQHPMTLGVEQRIEELAYRPAGYRPQKVQDFIYLLPLSEIISAVIGIKQLIHPSIWRLYNLLIEKFGNEYIVLLDATKEQLKKATNPLLANAIIKVRNNQIKISPEYDGEYGKIENLV
ncbi:MAG: endonuclease Q family protein, partial [Candidatus Bathyarchaeia archaeon]